MQLLDTLNHKARNANEWFAARAHGAHAKFWLAVLSFTESSVFLVPPDVLLIAILLAGAERWRYYAVFTAAWSVLGALAGYAVGALLYDSVGQMLVSAYGLADDVELAQQWFSGNTFLVMFIAALTPLPYKVFVLTGGFLQVNLVAFTLASILGRLVRFGLVAYITKTFGAMAAQTLTRYTHYTSLVLTAALLMALIYLLVH
jgi:membrane protein YqaA with SNARE-associated domain